MPQQNGAFAAHLRSSVVGEHFDGGNQINFQGPSDAKSGDAKTGDAKTGGSKTSDSKSSDSKSKGDTRIVARFCFDQVLADRAKKEYSEPVTRAGCETVAFCGTDDKGAGAAHEQRGVSLYNNLGSRTCFCEHLGEWTNPP